ncbi:MAG TPA: acetate--CoA ligase family protein, partial [Actinomycetes bacterium]|nr:acetate--CoA ligase family protein [Actinomycetes bacterium]
GIRRSRLARLLDPCSIAIFGASANPAKRGHQAMRALLEAGYPHPIHPVNPKGGKILGIPVARSIHEVSGTVDAALIATPATSVPGILRECADAGIAGAVVLAGGFGQAGGTGPDPWRNLRRVAAETGIRVIGPNTSGILNLSRGVDLVGLADVPRGPISVVTQSGNVLLSLISDTRALGGPGFDVCVGLGDQLDVSHEECLAFLAEHWTTRVVAIYAEGFRDGRAFLTTAARAVRARPVVLLHGGSSGPGRQAAISHSGSAATSARVTAAALRQAGVEVVRRSDELAVVAGVLATTPVPRSGRVAVLTDGGGHAALAADALTGQGVGLAGLAPRTRQRLREILGPDAAVGNPVDVAGATDAHQGRFVDSTEVLMSDTSVGMVLIAGLFGGYHLRFGRHLLDGEQAAAKGLVRLAERTGTPVVLQSCYANDHPSVHDVLREGGIQVVSSIEHAVAATAALFRRSEYLRTVKDRSDFGVPRVPQDAGDAADGGTPLPLTEPLARRLLERAGIGTGPWRLVTSPQEAEEVVARFARPCALKVVSPQAVHKSDLGGVRLHVTAENAADQYRLMLSGVAAAVPGAAIDGALVAPMVEGGVELLVGAFHDPVFGPMVALGGGGVLVEAIDHVTFRAAPLTMLEAREMIEEALARRLLDGVRGLPPVDRDQLAALLVRIGQFAANTPGVRELDLNPVIARGRELVPVDVRVVMRQRG